MEPCSWHGPDPGAAYRGLLPGAPMPGTVAPSEDAARPRRYPSNAAVSSIMSEGVYSCFEDDTIADAAQIMAEHQVRRLPVLNRAERLVGIIALADLARSGVKEAEERAIEGISQPSRQPRS